MVPKICTYESCEKTIKSRGLCATHWSRWRKHGDPSVVLVTQPRTIGCKVDDCERKHYAKGYCEMHGERVKRTGDPLVVGKLGAPPRKEAPSYSAAHVRIKRDRGRASDHSCVDCGGQAQEWSYDGGCPNELYETIVKRPIAYSTDQSRYYPRCKKCHRGQDKAYKRRIRGTDGRFLG